MLQKCAPLLVLGALLVPVDALACGGCVDHQMRIHLPFVGPLIPAALLWLLTVSFTKLLPFQRRLDRADRRPTRRALLGFWLLMTLGSIVLAMFFMGSLLAPWTIIGALWLGFLLFGTLGRPWRRAPSPEAARAWKIVGGIHLGFLVLASLAIAKGIAVPRSTQELVSLSGYRVSAVYTRVLPELISRGDEAVEPLIRAAERAVPASGTVSEDLATSSLYSLGQICSAKAEGFLAEFTRARISGRDAPGKAWRRALVHGYAQCAGPRAVDPLITLHAEATDRERWLFLAALVSTGSERGVIYALDHMEELLDAVNHPWPASPIARAVITALLDGGVAADVRAVPLLRNVHTVGAGPLLGASPNDLRSEFYWTKENEPPIRDRATLEQHWLERSSQVRSHWASALN